MVNVIELQTSKFCRIDRLTRPILLGLDIIITALRRTCLSLENKRSMEIPHPLVARPMP